MRIRPGRGYGGHLLALGRIVRLIRRQQAVLVAAGANDDVATAWADGLIRNALTQLFPWRR